jgi:hypothetical protein
MTPQYNGFSSCLISNNIISNNGTYGFVGIRVGCLSSAATIYQVSILNNQLNNFAIGINISTASGAIITECDVKNNSIFNVKGDTLTPTYTQGITLGGQVTQLNISNNTISSRVNQLYFGILLNSGTGVSLNNLYMESNFIGSNATSPFYIPVNIAGRRAGIQAVTFNALPTTSTWQIGDVAYNNSPTVLGSAGSQYVIPSWTRLTNGTGNTLNTDWVQNRTLTGT